MKPLDPTRSATEVAALRMLERQQPGISRRQLLALHLLAAGNREPLTFDSLFRALLARDLVDDNGDLTEVGRAVIRLSNERNAR